jgi:DNA invertase Pin-like site-specific DNA recombinase
MMEAVMKCAVYGRVSTFEQSSDTQTAECQRECARRGWEPVLYVDDGISGKRMKRPQFDAMLTAARAGQVQAVMAVSADRIGRNVLGVLTVWQELVQLKVQLVLLRGGVDTTSASGRAMAQMMAVFAELERGLNAERTRSRLAHLKAQGIHVGRPRQAPVDDVAILAAHRADPSASTRTLAAVLGVSASTVCRALRRAPSRIEEAGRPTIEEPSELHATAHLNGQHQAVTG